MGKLGMIGSERMDTVTLSSNMANYRNSAKTPASVAGKVLNRLEQQQSQKTVSLVQKNAPPVGNGNGKLVNLLV